MGGGGGGAGGGRCAGRGGDRFGAEEASGMTFEGTSTHRSLGRFLGNRTYQLYFKILDQRSI